MLSLKLSIGTRHRLTLFAHDNWQHPHVTLNHRSTRVSMVTLIHVSSTLLLSYSCTAVYRSFVIIGILVYQHADVVENKTIQWLMTSNSFQYFVDNHRSMSACEHSWIAYHPQQIRRWYFMRKSIVPILRWNPQCTELVLIETHEHQHVHVVSI